MPTTTNYSWTTPADTDLVKDGASAIRTLGTAIDTTTKNLNPSTTLGDIEYRSSTANTNTRLGIGTSGQVLSVSGGVPAWTTISTGSLTLLSTTTLSGSSTTISSISGSYTNLLIIGLGTYASADAGVKIWLNGNTTATNYQIDQISGIGTGISYQSVNSSDFFQSTTNNAWNRAGSFQIFIPRYAETEYKCIYLSERVRADRFFTGTMEFNSTAAISSIAFELSSGTWSGGTVYVYGVK